MAFTPRTKSQILNDMINFVMANTDITDFEPGSAARTFLEAASIEDDEQYFQMVQLLDAFDIKNATGELLDRRLADFNLFRLLQASSSGQVVILDNTLIQSPLKFSYLSGALSIQVESSVEFPSMGVFTIRIGEGTINVEDVTVTANNTGTGTFTLSVMTPLANNHDIGERVAYVTGVADTIVPPGQQVQKPATATNSPIKFVTNEEGTIVNGNYESTPIRAKAVVPGLSGNVGPSDISEFTASPSFNGAGVTNHAKFSGGRDIEADIDGQNRAGREIQALSKGIILAVRQAVLGISDPVTGQRVTSASVLEDLVLDEVRVYIDDGTGLTPDRVILATSELSGAHGIGTGALTLVAGGTDDFPSQGYVIVSPEDPTEIELLNYTSVSGGQLILSGLTTKVHDNTDEVVLVDTLELNAEAGTSFFYTKNFPLISNSQRLWLDEGGGNYILKTLGVDYFINRAIGQVQLVDGVPEGSNVVMTYAYYTGLVATAQKIISGDRNDPVNFPGVNAGGTRVFVDIPLIRRVSVRAAIAAASSAVSSDLVPLVAESIENYITSLGIGEDVILAEIITRAMEVPGVIDITIASPTNNITIAENELPVPFNSNNESLIIVG